MLKKLDIRRLFGSFSYSLDFINPDGEALKFITGPNGYGKTTVLAFINSLCRHDLGIFWKTPFESLKFFFDEATIEFRQTISYKEVEEEDFGPVRDKVRLTVLFSLGDSTETNIIELNEIDGITDSSLNLFLSSLSSCFVKDKRLEGGSQSGKDSVVKANAQDLATRLKAIQSDINSAQNISAMRFDSKPEKDDYDVRRKNILPKLELLKSFGLFKDEQFPKAFQSEIAVIQDAYLVSLEQMTAKVASSIDNLNLFSDIISHSGFVNKKMEIDPRFGYRFVVDDDVHEILDLECLSSGEQHLLVMAYELLFKAFDDSIVLIDEPEMSFHLMWQLNFMNDLKAIVKQRGIQALVSTHSPQTFNMDWDYAVDLYEQSTKDQE